MRKETKDDEVDDIIVVVFVTAAVVRNTPHSTACLEKDEINEGMTDKESGTAMQTEGLAKSNPLEMKGPPSKKLKREKEHRRRRENAFRASQGRQRNRVLGTKLGRMATDRCIDVQTCFLFSSFYILSPPKRRDFFF